MFYSILFATIIYSIINIIIGLWNIKNTTYEEVISNKNNSNLSFIVLSIVATIVGGGMFFATGQMGYEAGIAGLSLPISYAIGMLILANFVPKIRNFINENNCHTLYDVINNKLIESGKWKNIFNLLLIIINLIIYFFLLAGQFLILATFYNYFITYSQNFALFLAVLIIIFTTMVYSIFGGVKKDIATDTFQMLCIFIGVGIISFYIFNTQVLESFRTLPEKYLNGTGYGIIFPIGVILFFTPSYLVRYDFWQRIIASKSDKEAQKALYYSIPLVIIFYIVFIFIGMYAKILEPNLSNTNFATIITLKHILTPVKFVVVIIALYAAVMSSADTFLNISSISLYKLLNRNNIYNNKTLFDFRKYTILIGILSTLIIFISQDIINLMVGAFSSLIILVPSMMYILISKKPSGKIASLNTISSFLIFVIFFFFVKGFDKYAFVLATVVSCIIHIITLFILKFRKKKTSFII